MRARDIQRFAEVLRGVLPTAPERYKDDIIKCIDRLQTKRTFICVCSKQVEADAFRANYQKIKAPTRDSARSIYSRRTGATFIDVRGYVDRKYKLKK